VLIRTTRGRRAGALAYWGAWKNGSLRFARKDEKSIPEHWRTFGQRRSPITDSPRLAANPANALLNYLYESLRPRLVSPVSPAASIRGSGYSTPTRSHATRWRSMPWKRYGRRSTPICWT
jgi:hypothetical protein